MAAKSTPIAIALITLVLAFSTAIFLQNRVIDANLPTVSIGENTYFVEIADENAERKLGLGDRDSIEEGTGMLFVFERQGFYTFWMQDMKFPLDIVWINKDFKIVDIERDVSPDDYPQLYISIIPAKYVLEVNAGQMFDHGVQIGETVNISGL